MCRGVDRLGRFKFGADTHGTAAGFHFTSQCDRSYLCRIDMLHIGCVDEVLFGQEASERMPAIVAKWVAVAKGREEAAATAKMPGTGPEPKPQDHIGNAD